MWGGKCATDREVPVEMTLQALAHADGGNNDIRFVRGADNIGVRLFCEVVEFGNVLVRKLGGENKYAVRSEDSRRGGFSTSWRTTNRTQRRRWGVGTRTLGGHSPLKLEASSVPFCSLPVM